MFDGAIIPSDLYADPADPARPPRVIAPLQHIFDPVIGARDVYGRTPAWGYLPVPANGFSAAPRIVFERVPAIPQNLAEAMLYHLQLRLIEPALHIRHSPPAFTFGHPALDEGVTILPA